MLTSAEKDTLVTQLKFVFEQFVDTDQHALVHAVLRMSIEAVHAVLELSEAYTGVADDASCGPPEEFANGSTGSQVRCPHCDELF